MAGNYLISSKFMSVHLGRGQNRAWFKCSQLDSVKIPLHVVTFFDMLSSIIRKHIGFFILCAENETEEIKCLFLFLTRLITITGAYDNTENPSMSGNRF